MLKLFINEKPVSQATDNANYWMSVVDFVKAGSDPEFACLTFRFTPTKGQYMRLYAIVEERERGWMYR